MVWLNGYRMRLVLVGVVALVAACGGKANAMIIMSEPTNVGPVINDAYDVQECDFSHDGLELYFSANRSGGHGGRDIWVAKRQTLNSPWQEPINLGPAVNSSAGEVEPAISPDGLELYFRLWNQWNLLVARRPSKAEPWNSPVQVGPTINAYDAWEPDISADGLSLYFSTNRPGGYGGGDIWVASRTTTDDEWGEPVNLGPNVNRSGADNGPSISNDNLTLIFGRGVTSMWATTRKSVDDVWEPAVDLGIDNPHNFYGPALSPDGSTIYFDAHAVWGGYGDNDIWQVKFIPIVDFNSDVIVDIADLVILIEHWSEEDPLCDIGPLPLGDGMVNEADLEVLMSRWGQEAYDPALIAHWKLDEMEGDVAYDSARTNDAAVVGGTEWQPGSGQIDGALQLNGVDGYAITDQVLNPADGPFSVFTWVKGGAPGQVVLSQADGANWLCMDIVKGRLMTYLKNPRSDPLYSHTCITDNNWHHIGFVWDGSYRYLYADGIEVKKDTMPLSGLEGTGVGLYIGAGKDLKAGSFFSGLIDEVRIYNRAVRP